MGAYRDHAFKYSLYWQTRRAIKNATRLEESTGRWLSMMARDCNRFCKIMVCSSSSYF